MKPFDEEFADKVRAVFDRHDAPFDPSAWDAMHERLKQGRRGRVIAMLYVASRVAASLLIISVLTWISYTYFFTLTPSVSDSGIAEEVIAGSDIRQRHESAAATDALSHLSAPEDSALPAATLRQVITDRETGEVLDDNVSVQVLIDRETGLVITDRGTGEVLDDNVSGQVLIDRETGLVITDRGTGEVITDKETGEILPHRETVEVLPHRETVEVLTHRETGEILPHRETGEVLTHRETVEVLTDRESGQELPLAAEAVSEGTPTKDTLHDADIQQGLLSHGEQRTLPDPRLAGDGPADISLPSHEKQREKPLSWGLAAGSMMTYAEQQLAGGLGFSAGVTSAYRVTNRVSIASGLLLAYQQFEVESTPLVTMSAGKEYARTDMASVRTTADHSYEMLALDIPLNLQIRLPGAGSGRWYVSTGLSSLLYLQQQLSGVETSYVETNYLDPARNTLVYNSFTSSVAVSSNSAPFSHFDFARLLNLSAGYAIRQEKTTTIIEPFVKLPLGSISSRKLKMGMGGVSLRFTFGH